MNEAVRILLRLLFRVVGARFWSSVEFKLVLAWLVVVLATALLDQNHTYLTNPAGAADLIIRNTVLLGFFALGSAVIIISGGIDLSSGSVIAMSATVFASLLLLCAPEGFRSGNIPSWAVFVAILGTLTVGVAIGTLHAWLITCVGLPPFIATLATLVGLRSFSRGVTLTLTGKAQIDFTNDALRNTLKDVTNISIVFLIFAAIIWFLMSRTVLGRHLHAMGGNEQAAKLSGIRTDRLKWFAYVLGAVSASMVGIIYFADSASAKPDNLGRGYELNAIAASVIGGCSLQGGVGTIPGTILGCLFLRTVIDAVNKIVGTGADVYEGMIVGTVVILAVTFSQQAGGGAESPLAQTLRNFRKFIGLLVVLPFAAFIVLSNRRVVPLIGEDVAVILATWCLRGSLLSAVVIGVLVLLLTDIKRYFFASALGRSVIPIWGLLGGISFMLFFHSKPWYTPTIAVGVGIGIVALLFCRGYIEARWQRAT